MPGRIICRVFGHKINRRRVWHDGLNMRTTCPICRAPMIRIGFDWRPFDFEIDGDTQRDGHPRSRR